MAQKCRLILLAGLLMCSSLVSAQTLTGTIAGRVTDEQGGVLPGVTMTLTGSMRSQTQVTDANGDYRFIGLNPGTYALKAELQGFRPKAQEDLVLGLSKTVEVNLSMVVGGLSETIEVVGMSPMVDTRSAATDTNMSQSMLFSMPITHGNPAVTMLNYSPGINSGSAFGGEADTGNSLMLDGVDTRDPEGGSAWTFFNYNIIEEVQVGGLGQPAEYGGFTGAVVNTITKSGGNRFSQLSEYRSTSGSLGSNNVPADVVQQNPNLSLPPKVFNLKDYTVQLGGPLKKDKVFFFGSVQRYHIEQRITGPIRSEVSPRFNIKTTFQPSPNDSITASLQYDQYNQKGRTGFVPGYAITSQDQTIDQDSPEYIWNGQYRKVFGASSFLEAKFTGYWGYYDLNPVSQAEGHYDGETGAYSGGASWVSQYDRTRNQLNVSLTKYAEAAGRHSFKFGAEIERSTIRDRFVYAGKGVYYYDYGGEPYLAYTYSYDLKGKNSRESYYAQDQWEIRHVTANLGVRLDNIRGYATDTGEKKYSTFSVGPRAGLAWDLTGKGTSVLKGFYGQLYDQAVFSSWSRGVGGYTDFITYEVGPNWSTLTEIDRVPAESKYRVSDNLKHPRTDETNVAWEQQIGRNFKFTATGIYRNWKNFLNSVLINGTWEPVPYSNALTNQSMTVYRWANRSSIPQQFLIQNTDTVTYQLTSGGNVTADAYRKYKGLMLVFQRAFRNRWQGQLSYVLSQTKGTVTNSGTSGISSGQFETPNGILVNADGYSYGDRTHEVKLFGGYQIPRIEVSVNGYWRFLSGRPYTAYANVASRTFNWTSSLSTNLEPRGSHRNDNWTQLDLRVEKVFNYSIHRFGVYVDMENLFNQGVVTARQDRYPNRAFTCSGAYAGTSCSGFTPTDPGSYTLPFGGPTTLIAGRQVTFGGRWSF